jgi:hypothetical protein
MFKNITFHHFLLYSIVLLILGCQSESITLINSEINITRPEDKIWAHRVNSISDLENRIYDFKGIEIDIFYNKKNDSFEVKHDLEEVGTDLELFLDVVLKTKKVMIWFDYKNLNISTDKGVKKLYSILKSKELEHKTFVESYYANLLPKFEGKLATSLWVSSVDLTLSKREQNKLYIKKYKQFKNSKVTMLSASFEMYNFLSKYFPNKKCNYWMSGELNAENIQVLNKMSKAPNVNVILIDGNKNFVKY